LRLLGVKASGLADVTESEISRQSQQLELDM